MSTAPLDEDDAFAESSVFRKPPARAWAVSFAAHAAAFVALGVVGTFIGVKAGVIPPTIIELDAPPPRRPPPVTPPPPPRAAPPSAAAQPRAARPNAARTPSNRPGRSGRSNAPHVLAAQGDGSGGDAMPVGDNNDFQGGVVGNGGVPATEPAPAPSVPADDQRPRRAEPSEVAEENLAVHAVVDCDDAALSGLYPQQALDNEIEVTTLAIELVVNSDGSLANARARSNPGFGIAAAMERGALSHCRVTTVPRDGRGVAVRTRVLKRIRFLFE